MQKKNKVSKRAEKKRKIVTVIAVLGIACMVVPMAISPLLTSYSVPAVTQTLSEEDLRNLLMNSDMTDSATSSDVIAVETSAASEIATNSEITNK